MWPLRVIFLCVFLLVSTHAFESFNPRFSYLLQTDPDSYEEERHPMLVKRQVIEVKRKEAIARARCFFNPITC
ncbi:unnamed protein product [Nippostrongylus brasiliensis]|uniref:Uncharacterized protein n=1 Tax=Nippostrongylus brasiliensis TaxID=27835 RepID=A0A158R3I9_NIPBR|nr:hypothetical protein Q1695_009470 [Nippostrongylus brasiliensis]VDL82140.1 unnamed protein product [Nippostrongylus brasiliensis]